MVWLLQCSRYVNNVHNVSNMRFNCSSLTVTLDAGRLSCHFLIFVVERGDWKLKS